MTQWVKTVEEFRNHCYRALSEPVVYIDTETTGLDPHTLDLLLISLQYGDTNVVFDFTEIPRSELRWIKPLLESRHIVKVIHNAIFDYKVFLKYGLSTQNMYCSLIAEQVLTAGYIGVSCSLGNTIQRRVGVTLNKEVREGFINFQGNITEEQVTYASQDVLYLPTVYAQQWREIKEQNLERIIDLEMADIEPTAMMEYVGICINEQKLFDSRPVFEALLKRADTAIQDEVIRRGLATEILFTQDGYVAVNTASPSQMLQVFKNVGINVPSLNAKDLAEWDSNWVEQKSKGKIKKGYDEFELYDGDFDVDIAIGFQHPFLKLHGIRTAVEKILKTYVVGLTERINPVTKRVHPGYRQCGAAATGRYSSSNPNFQNIVNKKKLTALGLGEWDIRSMFIPSPGHKFIICDYSAIELVITACYSDDQILIDQIMHGDIHSYVATTAFGIEVNGENKGSGIYKILRDCAKTLTYAILYGTTGRNLERTLGTQLAQCGVEVTSGMGDQWIALWHKMFPVAGSFLHTNANLAVTRGYVETVLGRRRRWSLKFDNKWQFYAAQREGSNSAIQGSSADMMKLAIRDLYAALDKSKARIVGTIHDELLIEARDEFVDEIASITQYCMEEAGYKLFPKAREYGIIKAEPKVSGAYDK